MFEGALLGLGIGILRGGRLKGLLKADFKAVGLLLCAFIVEFTMTFTGAGRLIERLGNWALITAAVVQYSCFLGFILYNITRFPMWPIGLGGLLNMVVVVLNGGKMPVNSLVLLIAPENASTLKLAAGEVSNYIIASENTKLLFLGDMIPIWSITRSFASIGDLVIAVGLFVLVQHLLLSCRNEGYNYIRSTIRYNDNKKNLQEE